VHRRSREDHCQALGERLGAIGAVLVGGINGFEVVHPQDADVTAERQRLDAVLGLALAHRPEPRAEPQEVLGDLHPRRLGDEEVTELVQHDHEDDGGNDDERRKRSRPYRQRDRHGDDEDQLA